MFVWMTALTGLIYPLLITGIAQLIMKEKADGDFLLVKDKVVGSALIAQKFEGSQYFWSRPSANDYNPLHSGGSNLGPISKKLKKIVEERKKKILQTNPSLNPIPTELLFASGSGLDPHISPETAYFQIERIAKARGLENRIVQDLVDKITIAPSLGFIGVPHVNVLMLNKSLDELSET